MSLCPVEQLFCPVSPAAQFHIILFSHMPDRSLYNCIIIMNFVFSSLFARFAEVAANSENLVPSFFSAISHFTCATKTINLNHVSSSSLFLRITFSGSLATTFHLTIFTGSVCLHRMCGHFHWIEDNNNSRKKNPHASPSNSIYTIVLLFVCPVCALHIDCNRH